MNIDDELERVIEGFRHSKRLFGKILSTKLKTLSLDRKSLLNQHKDIRKHTGELISAKECVPFFMRVSDTELCENEYIWFGDNDRYFDDLNRRDWGAL